MPIPTAFHTRTAPLNEYAQWRNWAGYFAPIQYDYVLDHEYYALRNRVGLIDVSPLYKYEIIGADALRLLQRLVPRDMSRARIGRVYYTVWCDDNGKVIDDGTITRLAPSHFRLTSAEANLRWVQDVGVGMDVQVTDVSQSIAALSLQGPKSKALLRELAVGFDVDALKYFRMTHGQLGDWHLTISRTGYTGDLGYELWMVPDHAEPVWDLLMQAGQRHGISPVGLAAMDMARVEAGLLLNGVDYIPANQAHIEAQTSTPYELGLGWMVKAKTADYFIGQPALQSNCSDWAFVGIAVDWFELERLYKPHQLRPQVVGVGVQRTAVPIYNDQSQQIGQATSRVFSPLLRQYIALATVQRAYADIGTPLQMELTVEYARKKALATVTSLPFYNPLHKKS